MNGYEILITLECETELWRILKIPKDINFLQLHKLIQKLFNFDDYHSWNFKVPEAEDTARRIITDDSAEDMKITEAFEEYDLVKYTYDYGNDWRFKIEKLEDIDYNKKTALLVDYKCKYCPLEDMGGKIVFDQIMQNIDFAEDVLEAYGLSRRSLSKMDMEKRFNKGSRMIIP